MKETMDDLQIKGYRILQKEHGFRFGMDAVLLSSFVKVKPDAVVLDLGTGTGILPILIEAKTKAASLTGLEILPEMVSMARRSVKLNHLEHKIQIVEGDIKQASAIFQHDGFDAVVSNPPYLQQKRGYKNPESAKAVARHEILCEFQDVSGAARVLLKNKGSLFLVHRSQRLAEIIGQLQRSGLEPKRIRMVYSREDTPSHIFLMEAVKDGRTGLKVEPPLIIYGNDGNYSKEIFDIYGMDQEEH